MFHWNDSQGEGKENNATFHHLHMGRIEGIQYMLYMYVIML